MMKILTLLFYVLIKISENNGQNLTPIYPINTIGGNSNGAKCHFPFLLRNKTYFNCIDMKIIDNYGDSHSKICSTTSNMDRDNKWGFCLDYSQCHFPFKYKNKEYNDCISGTRSSRFCPTTYDYEIDKKWAYCPFVCHGYPKTKGAINKSNSFNLTLKLNESACNFQEYYSKISNQLLRVFSHPPCHTSFECKDLYFTHKNRIKCDIDGKFNSQAVCLKKDNSAVGIESARMHRMNSK